MNKPKVFIAKPVPGEVFDYVSENCDCKIWDSDDDIPKDVLFDELRDAEGLLTSGTKIDSELLSHAPNLKVVSNISVGYNNFDLKEMKKRGVLGTNTPYVLDDTVADLIFGLILSSARRIAELDRYVKQGKWNKGDNENLFGIDVHHSVIGIIGMGRIGEKVAKRAKFGFDMDIIYHNRHKKTKIENKLGAKYVELDELLRKSDYIVLMTPLTKETEHMISYNEFNLMKKTSIFINASRGKTVDEAALIDALTCGKIFAAGLDVFTNEPIEKDSHLLKMDNVVTVPHIGSATYRTRLDMAKVASKNLVQVLLGKKPQNIVTELKD